MEWKKILVNRKIIGLISILFILQMIVFGNQWYRYREVNELENRKEQQTYIDTFHESVEQVIEQADSLDGISIFSEENTFSSRNVKLTKSVFIPLLQVQLTYVKGQSIEDFFSFTFGRLCLAIGAIAIALAMSEVGNTGIRRLSFTTKRGKWYMALHKIGALLVWSFILTLVFQLSILLEGLILYQEDFFQILFCPIQTFELFAYFPWIFQVWQVLLIYLFYRTWILFVVMMFVWMLALVCNHIILSMGIMGGFLVAEYFLYVRIGEHQVWNLLKYCNMWYQIAENHYFIKYLNLNIGGYAINRNTVILTVLFMVGLCSASIGSFIWCKRFPCNSKVSTFSRVLAGISQRTGKIRGRFLENRSLLGAEIYKVLFLQKGWMAILLLAVLMFYQVDFTQIQRSTKEEMYYEFMERYMGAPSEASQQEIEQLEEKLNEVDTSYSEQMAEESIDSETKILLNIWYDSFDEEREFLDEILNQTESLKEIQQERGIDVWYVNLYSYYHLLQEDNLLLNLGLVLVLAWFCIGMYAGEKAGVMIPLIRTCKRERYMYRTKLRATVLLAVGIHLLVVCYQLVSVAIVYGIKGVNAPVQSILELSDIKIKCTIWQYFFARYLGKMVLILFLCLLLCKGIEKIVCKKEVRYGTKNRKSVENVW